MKITAIRSDKIYKKIICAKATERDDIYRYELMKPFEFKWSCVGIPIKADKPDDYDVVTASSLSGGLKLSEIDSRLIDDVKKISDEGFWK